MKKKVVSFLFVLLLIVSMTFTAFARWNPDYPGPDNSPRPSRVNPHMIDYVN